MAMRIPISFKESEKELYEYLNLQISPSVFVKECILEKMGKTRATQPVKKNKGFEF